MEEKSLIILYSYHHHNTEKVANVMAKVLEAQIKKPHQVNPNELQGYDLIGFGSGIYSDKHHQSLLNFAENIPHVNNKNAFIFSTCGVPAFALRGEYVEKYIKKAHSTLREKFISKGYKIMDEFMCVGFNTNSFLKFFGGLNKGRPNAEDLKNAEDFVRRLN
jgi:flavodoxin